MKIIDVSRKVREGMETYPGDPEFAIEQVKGFEKDGYILSRATLGLHTGTHVDAPAHFIEGGKTVDQLPAVITGRAIYSKRPETSRPVLILNRELKSGEADLLVSSGLEILAVGTLSVGSPEIHKKLLGKGIIVVEGLDLSGVEFGEYELTCMPLKIKGAEAAPARCVLRQFTVHS